MVRFFIRYTILDNIANSIIAEYDRNLLEGNPQAIPIEDIIEQHFGINVEYHAIRKDRKVLGCTVFNSGEVPVWFEDEHKYDTMYVPANTFVIDDILLEPSKYGRYRFTLGHELGHFCIHQNIYRNHNIALANTEKSLQQNKWLERQADHFAESILMPKVQVLKAFYNITNNICELAKIFEVSKEAMRICLENHNLIFRRMR